MPFIIIVITTICIITWFKESDQLLFGPVARSDEEQASLGLQQMLYVFLVGLKKQ
jgi:hypothetical protein